MTDSNGITIAKKYNTIQSNCYKETLASITYDMARTLFLVAFQRRPGYQKIHYISYKEKYKQEEEEAMNNQDNRPNEEQDVFVSHTMSMKAYKRWKRFKKVLISFQTSL